MDRTKAKLAAIFDENDECDPSFPQKPVDDAKLSQYVVGKVRKSKREKELEAAEAKRKEEEANAAKAYAEFLDAFEGEGVGRRQSGSNFVKAGGESRLEYAAHSAKKVGRPSPLRRSISPSSALAPKPKGKRAMDSFLEEIKREQAEREARYRKHGSSHGRSVTAMAAYEGQSGSKDRGDPQTSNLFIANLPSHVTEQSLGNFFAKVGPVGSVKVMWPRSDATQGPGAEMTNTRRAKNVGLSGFVSFMKRKDAETALREYDGFNWGGCVLRVGWSKAVPIASKPLYVSGEMKSKESWSRSSSSSRSRSRGRSRSRHSRSRDDHRRHSHRSKTRSWSRSRSPLRSSRRKSHRYGSNSRSTRRKFSRSPITRSHTEEEEAVTDIFIRTVAGQLRGHDEKYEEALCERERNNPKYSFLLHRNHRRHAFYKGLVQSEIPLSPEFDDDGYCSIYSSDSAEDSERERSRKTTLGKLARKRFEAMLRALTGKRGEIARCMTFSLEHGEAAHEVADIIVASLLVDGTAVPRKVARLHLICDILHNSAASVPSAWKFRQEFQCRLGIVFDHLASIYHSFPGRMTAETFKKQITTVVDIWEDWIVFPPSFTTELRQRLEGPSVQSKEEDKLQTSTKSLSSRFKESTFSLASEQVLVSTKPKSPEQAGSDGEPMDVSSDLDGEAIQDDVDGIPVGDTVDDDVDGIPIDDDVDGVPVKDGVLSNVDGVPFENDNEDGVPVDDTDIVEE